MNLNEKIVRRIKMNWRHDPRRTEPECRRFFNFALHRSWIELRNVHVRLKRTDVLFQLRQLAEDGILRNIVPRVLLRRVHSLDKRAQSRRAALSLAVILCGIVCETVAFPSRVNHLRVGMLFSEELWRPFPHCLPIVRDAGEHNRSIGPDILLIELAWRWPVYAVDAFAHTKYFQWEKTETAKSPRTA